jgi:hypothetical protein
MVSTQAITIKTTTAQTMRDFDSIPAPMIKS